ncbi:Diencephalon/mesencephalon homeobox protein 1-B [Aphelenchoides bicaudatus]|nr:Diencephalon/mesencephalon homeobox protein 1-B [Aphelenchoides bicaudatus]
MGEKSRGQRKQVIVEEEPKLRRNRTAFNDSQLDKLERCFQSCQYPTVAIRDRLARETGLPESKIQVWYKNRRAKHRKHLRNLPADDSINDEITKSHPSSDEPSLNVISWDPKLFGHFFFQDLQHSALPARLQ